MLPNMARACPGSGGLIVIGVANIRLTGPCPQSAEFGLQWLLAHCLNRQSMFWDNVEQVEGAPRRMLISKMIAD